MIIISDMVQILLHHLIGHVQAISCTSGSIQVSISTFNQIELSEQLLHFLSLSN